MEKSHDLPCETSPVRFRPSRRAVIVALATGVAVPSLAGRVAGKSGDAATLETGYGTGGYGDGRYGDALTPTGPGDVTGDGRAATDPDADGRYEDVIGDERLDLVDVREFLARFDDVPADEKRYFDFNADGTVDIRDVAELLEEI